MELLDATFSQGPRMVPAVTSTTDASRASALLQLERELVRDWFSLVFYPVEGEALQQTQARFLATLRRVDDALGETEGPWFLGDAPSLVECARIIAPSECPTRTCMPRARAAVLAGLTG
eukprot:5305033-Prymnesium_polylepis.1